MVKGNKFSDFHVGQQFIHKNQRTITETDLLQFCELTMNCHPVHTNEKFAEQSVFGQRLVVGTYTLSLIVGISVEDLSYNAIANLGYSNVNHLLPVFIGDTLTAKSKVVQKKVCSDLIRGIVQFETIGLNQRNEEVINYRRSIIMKINKSGSQGLHSQLSKYNCMRLMNEKEYLINLPKIQDERGNLTFLDQKNQIPFEINRIYYLYDIPANATRGGHAHIEMEQVLIALSGSFDVKIFDGTKWKIYSLRFPFQALYIPPRTWRELENFSSCAICLSIVSTDYSESDYIRDLVEYKKYINH